MFYSHDLLCRRKNGKFSIIWLAATNKKKLNRLSCLKVNISQTCDEIANVIMTQHSSSGRGRVKFSLYLSSLLMHGTCMVFKQQVEIFLTDLILVKQGLSRVHLNELGFLVHTAVKEHHPREGEGDESDQDESGKSKPKKRKRAKAKVTELTVADIDDQAMAPLPVLPLQPPQPVAGQPQHLLNEADSHLHTVDLEFYQPLSGFQEEIVGFEGVDNMGALFREMDASLLARQNAQLTTQDVATILEAIEEQPMEIEVPTEMAPLPQDVADVVPMETAVVILNDEAAAVILNDEPTAMILNDEAAAVVQTVENAVAPMAQEDMVAPPMEEGDIAGLGKEMELAAEPIPMVIEQEPRAAEPTTAQPPATKKSKRKAAVAEPAPVIPKKRKRLMQTFTDCKTFIDTATMNSYINDDNIIRKTRRIERYLDDIPDFRQSLTHIRPEELLGIPAMNVVNAALKRLYDFKLRSEETTSNITATDKSRAGSDISKVSFDRSRLSLNIPPTEEESAQIPVAEEDLSKIAQIDVEIENILLEQLEMDLPAVEVPDVVATDLLQVSQVMPPIESGTVEQNPLTEPEAVTLPVQSDTVEQNLPEAAPPTLQSETLEVGPTAPLDSIVDDLNHLVLEQNNLEIPIEEEFIFEEFVVPPKPVDKEDKRKKTVNSSMDSSFDSNTSSQTPRSQTESVLMASLEYYWARSDKVVTFRAVCHPTTSNRKRAAKMFSILLEMKKHRKVELKQDDPMVFGTIEIHPSNYSSSSSMNTTSGS